MASKQELLDAMEAGTRLIVQAGEHENEEVVYAERRKSDPQPWKLRHSDEEVRFYSKEIGLGAGKTMSDEEIRKGFEEGFKSLTEPPVSPLARLAVQQSQGTTEAYLNRSEKVLPAPSGQSLLGSLLTKQKVDHEEITTTKGGIRVVVFRIKGEDLSPSQATKLLR
jgi:hypothetical protein